MANAIAAVMFLSPSTAQADSCGAPYMQCVNAMLCTAPSFISITCVEHAPQGCHWNSGSDTCVVPSGCSGGQALLTCTYS